ncbi:MAG: hypothetical protein PVJ84_08100 [Desulfobacteraceae bacterium]
MTPDCKASKGFRAIQVPLVRRVILEQQVILGRLARKARKGCRVIPGPRASQGFRVIQVPSVRRVILEQQVILGPKGFKAKLDRLARPATLARLGLKDCRVIPGHKVSKVTRGRLVEATQRFCIMTADRQTAPLFTTINPTLTLALGLQIRNGNYMYRVLFA